MRALASLSRSVASQRLTSAVQAHLALPPDNVSNQPTVLPGFTVYDADEHGRAERWLVPRLGVDLEEVVQVYEEFVDRPLGTVRCPERVARRLYRSKRSQDFFGPLRRPEQWWLPGAQLVAVASTLTKETPVRGEASVSLDLGGMKMEVTPRGCWSNFTGAMRRARVPAADADFAPLYVPMLLTDNPLAQALAAAGATGSALWAANSAIRAADAGRLPRTFLAGLSAPRRGRGAARQRVTSLPDKVGAMAECREILDQCGPGSLRSLYASAVPALMTASDFIDMVGDPWKNNSRAVGPTVAERFSAFLTLVEGRL